MTDAQHGTVAMNQRNGVYTIDTTLWLPRGIDEVFAFHCDAHNLERLTPSWLRFHVLTPKPIDMHVGTLIDYKLRIRGFPVRWQSEITAWQPPDLFIDEQRRGPYKLWHHEHRFTAQDGGTLIADHVDYLPRGGALANRLLVKPDLQRVFRYRHEQLRAIFAAGT